MFLPRELALATLILFEASVVHAGFYGKTSAVTSLDSENFDQEILQFDNAAVVEFYAPWCGHCQSLKPAYEKAAASMKGLAKVAAIDCDDEKNKPTCSQFGVQGFPTLKIFRPSGRKGKPAVEEYQGARTAKAIADAVAERIPNHVTKLTAAKWDDFLSKENDTAKAILFTSKGTTGALWKSLAIDFKDAISFSQIRDKEKDAVDAMGVTKFPTIVLLPGGSAAGKVYDDKMEKQALFDFFAAVKPTKRAGKSSSSSSKSSKSTKANSSLSEESTTASASSSTAESSPSEKSIPEIPTLADLSSLRASCFARKSKTCVLAVSSTAIPSITEVFKKLNHRGPPHAFQLFTVDVTSTLGKEVSSKLDLGDAPKVVTVNHRGWFRLFSGDVEKSEDVLAWLDAVKMGEGKKGSIPDALMEENKEEAKLDEKLEKKEGIKDEL